ncbi:RNA polymerase sigma factor [Clostridium cellulovorans]|uniref:RNA polymerase, sigma-24 subunit, ECF subfamily n=1 Tax=Clostridium cellulovorans (strain ATCC 35296 / DSM 3052 / OCM 3 / 743B) TaxID=573061 RepID=D9SPH1_CLOC7|nr:RNA polymerase sigma factor [Clostridium cellulovorans]ADL50020.1 RNA polymerase, sigma-24 subunit, ECF subfamily [Clostridium cellulovorans 743B]
MYNLQDFVQKSKNGDISAFMELLKEKESLIYNIAFSYTKNPYDAEDCISEASIKAFDKLKQLRSEEKFYCWFISILINVCRKNVKTSKSPSSEEDLHNIRDEFSYQSVDDKLIIEDLLCKLKEDDREIIVLRYLKDYSIKDIAMIMDMPLSTIKTRIYRSLAYLREKNGGMKNEY